MVALRRRRRLSCPPIGVNTAKGPLTTPRLRGRFTAVRRRDLYAGLLGGMRRESRLKGRGPRGRALPQEAKRGGPGSDQRAPERPGQEGGVPPRPRSGVGQIRQERGEARAGRGRGGARSQTRALNHLQGNRLGGPAGPSRCVCCCVCGMRVPKPLQERARRVLTSEDRGIVFFSFATCFDTQGSGDPCQPGPAMGHGVMGSSPQVCETGADRAPSLSVGA